MERKNENIKIKETTSIQLASYLLAKGCTLKGLNRKQPEKIVFILESGDIESLADEYLSYKGSIDPRRLFSAHDDLKALVFET